MALLAALVALEVREWVRELTGRDGLADAAGWMFALSPPLVHYAGLVFTEVPAALALSFGLRHARRADLRPGRGRGPGRRPRGGRPAVAERPLRAARRPRGGARPVAAPARAVALAALAPALVSAAGLLAYHQVLYGFWDPRRVYGRRPEFALSTLAEGLPGLLLKQEFGLLVYAPVLALALPGFAFLWRRDRRLAIIAAAAVVAVLLTAGTWPMWRGGFNPPARFLVPIAPSSRSRWRSSGTAGAHRGGLAPPRLDAVDRPRRRVRPAARSSRSRRDGPPVPAAFRGPGVDRPPAGVRAGRPRPPPAGVPLGGGDSRRAAVARPAGDGATVAAAALGLVLAAQAAAAVTHARTDDRDAVRLVGRPAVRLPGWSIDPQVSA